MASSVWAETTYLHCERPLIPPPNWHESDLFLNELELPNLNLIEVKYKHKGHGSTVYMPRLIQGKYGNLVEDFRLPGLRDESNDKTNQIFFIHTTDQDIRYSLKINREDFTYKYGIRNSLMKEKGNCKIIDKSMFSERRKKLDSLTKKTNKKEKERELIKFKKRKF